MLRINLSTRPFYNERAVHLAMLVVGLVGIIFLGSGTARLLSLAKENRTLSDTATKNETEAQSRTAEAEAVLSGTGETDLSTLVTAARQVNNLIAQRIFSWTAFLNSIEETLPPSVRLESLRPDISAGVVSVTLGVVGRGTEGIDEFAEALEGTGSFGEILVREQELAEGRAYRAVLVGRYFNGAVSEIAGEEISK